MKNNAIQEGWDLVEKREYLNCIFYCKEPLSKMSVALDIIECIILYLKLPKATVSGVVRPNLNLQFEASHSGWTDFGFGKGRVDVCNDEVVEKLRRIPDVLVSVLFESVRSGAIVKWADVNWSLRINGATPKEDGCDYSPQKDIATIALSIGRELLESVDSSKHFKLVTDLVDLIANKVLCCHYGFVEVESAGYMIGTGPYADDAEIMLQNDISQIERLWWDSDTDQARTVRRVYWGNFLCKSHVDYLGEKWIKRFAKHQYINVAGQNTAMQQVIRYSTGAAFLAVTDFPLYSSPSTGIMRGTSGRANSAAAVLRKAFRDRGMLI